MSLLHVPTQVSELAACACDTTNMGGKSDMMGGDVWLSKHMMEKASLKHLTIFILFLFLFLPGSMENDLSIYHQSYYIEWTSFEPTISRSE